MRDAGAFTVPVIISSTDVRDGQEVDPMYIPAEITIRTGLRPLRRVSEISYRDHSRNTTSCDSNNIIIDWKKERIVVIIIIIKCI